MTYGSGLLCRMAITGIAGLAAVGCGDHPAAVLPPLGEEASLVVSLQSGPVAGAAGRVAVAVVPSVSPKRLAALQGVLRFDPRRLRYVGQPLEGSSLKLVGDAGADEGVLRLACVDVFGLPRQAALLVFEQLAGAWSEGLRFQLDVAETVEGRVLGRAQPIAFRSQSEPVRVPEPRRLDIDAWAAYLAPDLWEGARTQRVPGEYRENLVFGDATLDGTINVLDAFRIANVSIGNFEMIERSDDPNNDVVVAGNVSPANLPGLGEAGDPLPPGVQSDGTRIINVLDVSAIQRESVGIPQPIVGDPIPGRAPVPASRVVVTGDIDSDRTFTRDTVYELQGTVNVISGATLTVLAGTRIEGDVATTGALVVRRGSNILAQGTFLEPVVFTCNAPAPDRGCWGGVTINGWAPLNNGDGPCCGGNEKTRAGTGTYGGIQVQDTSGVLSYVRIERAGAMFGFGAMPGLSLMGVGSGTTLDHIQVHRSGGDGLFISGGKADLRYAVLTDHAGTALRWDDGWGANSILPPPDTADVPGGRVQFLVIRQDAGGVAAIHGSNAPSGSQTPWSLPQIMNATVVGNPGSAAPAVVLENGTGALIGNTVITQAGGAGLDINGAESCALVGQTAGLRVEHTIWHANAPDLATDADCVNEPSYFLTPGLGNSVIDPLLTAPLAGRTADVRPRPGSPVTTDPGPVPNDGFFDVVGAAFVGAVGVRNLQGSNIPWFTGWTRWGTEYP